MNNNKNHSCNISCNYKNSNKIILTKLEKILMILVIVA